jgi:NADP-dependent 3-hydroxy acid dehydrogenase YdfG
MRSRESISRSLGAGYFRGRTAMVTGASSGIGRDISLTLAQMGAKVALMARRKALLDQLASQIKSDGGHALVLPADVTRRDELHDAVRYALADFGHIDILINSAGILLPGPVESMNPDDLEKMMAVNLFGTLHALQAVLPSMRTAGSGSVVNIASLAGRRGMPPLGGYCATKFAVVGLTEALRVELYDTSVRVSLVMPGVVDTPMVSETNSKEMSRGMPNPLAAMPVQWVTWAVLAAVVLGLAEGDVPPGAAVAEKIAALFPGLTDTALALGTRFVEWASRRS